MEWLTAGAVSGLLVVGLSLVTMDDEPRADERTGSWAWAAEDSSAPRGAAAVSRGCLSWFSEVVRDERESLAVVPLDEIVFVGVRLDAVVEECPELTFGITTEDSCADLGKDGQTVGCVEVSQ